MIMRDNAMATAGELSASIAHEVNQPLTGIVTRANAGLRGLSAEKPDIGKARDALSQIVAAGHRASEVLVSVRAMFKKETVEEVPVNINDLIAAVLRLVRPDLEDTASDSTFSDRAAAPGARQPGAVAAGDPEFGDERG